jgi:hypothetical protein
MNWATVGREGSQAHATQARAKFQAVAAPACQRYGISQSQVPFQPNGSAANGQDNAVLFGSVIADPGGMPLGSTYTVKADYLQAPGVPFQVTVAATSGKAAIGAGKVSLAVPDGWTVSGNNSIGPINSGRETSVTLTVTPAAGASLGQYKIAANFSNGVVTAYNDARVELVSGVEGRFQRWGNFAEYDQWAAEFTYVGGRSSAQRQIGAGETITVPVVVTNRTTDTQSGNVTLTLPAGIVADATTKPYADLAPGGQTTINFVVTHTNPADPGGVQVPVRIDTTSGTAPSSETLTLFVVPTTIIPQAATAPVVDGKAGDPGYGPALDISRVWEGSACVPNGVDCGAGSTLQLAWKGDDLYVLAHVIDNRIGSIVTPQRCFGHWLVDSVEVLLDPMSGSRDTSTTFKSGIIPVTTEGGPCWERDADNNQGYSSGTLSTGNAPGQEVAVDVAVNPDGSYAGGGYTIETKIPLADLPAAVVSGKAPTGDSTTNEIDARYLGLNVTPYDSDTSDFIGKTRLAWSPFGSQQSEPYRWGHAYLDGYTAPAGRSLTPSTPTIPASALMGVASPQTIYQSAARGVTISGLPASDGLSLTGVALTGTAATVSVQAKESGTVRAFAWTGTQALSAIQVWNTSCLGDTLGYSSCAATDNTAAPWAPNMGGHLLASVTAEVTKGKSDISITLDPAARAALGNEGSILVSYESASGGVDAWYIPVK